VLAATQWMIRNPEAGVRVPDELPWDEVLADAKPYLGTYHDGPADWTPLDNQTQRQLFGRFQHGSGAVDPDDAWQFPTFPGQEPKAGSLARPWHSGAPRLRCSTASARRGRPGAPESSRRAGPAARAGQRPRSWGSTSVR